jgi:hypothetical protein
MGQRHAHATVLFTCSPGNDQQFLNTFFDTV